MSEYGIKYNGNINLDKRVPLINEDGSVSTESSIGISDGNGTEYLIPTVVNGKRLSEDDARSWFQKTGEHLGSRPTPKDDAGWNQWEKYANDIHLRQADTYKSMKDLYQLSPQDVKVKGLGLNGRSLVVPEEPGLIDVSDITIGGLGGLTRNIIRNIPRNIETTILRNIKPKTSPINSQRGANFREWSNGSPTKILYRGDPKYYESMSPISGTKSKHNLNMKYFSDNPVDIKNYHGRNIGSNATAVHGNVDDKLLFDWTKRRNTKIPKQITDKYNKYSGVENGMSIESGLNVPQPIFTEMMKDMGYRGIKDGRQIGYFDEGMYKSLNNSGVFGKNNNIMNSTVPLITSGFGLNEILNTK